MKVDRSANTTLPPALRRSRHEPEISWQVGAKNKCAYSDLISGMATVFNGGKKILPVSKKL